MNKVGIPLRKSASAQVEKPAPSKEVGSVFFAAGFRPFFLSAALQAALMLPLWLAMLFGWLDLGLHWPAIIWHGHEMVFGFAGAAIGGFLLTAVPNWTNTIPVDGRPLMMLFSVWLLGRAALLFSGWLPPFFVAAMDLAYLPLLAVLVAKPLIYTRAWHNIAFLPILTVLWLCDLTMYIGDAVIGLHAAIGLLLLLIVVIAGRIVPSFTRNWLFLQHRQIELRRYTWIERGGAVGSLVLAIAAWVLAPRSPIAGALLFAAAALHLVRLLGWRGLSALSEPLLWVLHLGYLWLVVGLTLLGLSVFVAILPTSAALHALTAGCVATMIIGVMSRATLGHSGRPLTLTWLTVAAYLLVTVGAAMRLVAPLTPVPMALIEVGGLLWALAWVLFIVVYWPILTRPRIDGQPG